ncbi:MAG: ATP-dependent DNA helicase RecG [Rhodobacteraceae bacterium]|nr:ATP-dependent DNA helicase RecG [Paracoccaceae bacterium]
MSARPEILFPLFGDTRKLSGIGPKGADALAKAGLTRPKDLLFTLPHSGVDRRLRKTLKGLDFPTVATVEVLVNAHRNAATRGPFRVLVSDAELDFQLVFFRPNTGWLKEQLPEGERRIVSGKVELYDGIAQMQHPEHILKPDEADQLPAFEPSYSLTQGITQRAMRKAVAAAVHIAPDLAEWIEPSLLKKHGWPAWKPALEAAHTPMEVADLLPTTKARERLAYDELFAHQLTLAIARAQRRASKGISTVSEGRLGAKLVAALPFVPTGAQNRAVAEIVADLAAETKMNRLLQGDVGAGKTLVAMLAMCAVVEAGGQAAMMAPTEILARQHMESLREMALIAGLRMELLTGRDKGKARAAKLAALEAGEIDILLGTHAIFQKDVHYKDLRLAIVDEQHRFGVSERMQLSSKGRAVDSLVMTATPIPRSLALSHFGDMDVSVLDEKPVGRLPIETVVVSSGRLEEVVEKLRGAIALGQQVFWVCPLVEESEVMALTAAEERYRLLRLALGEAAVGLVHGQLKPKEKDAAMADFVAGNTKVLVATTVIEVGVDVPNATIMVIEGAQNFGLAQLHQLRGRVGRGHKASTCLLMYDPPLTQSGAARLGIMRETEDGFRIADEDLRLRGAGDLLGVKQSGLPQFRVADLETQEPLMKIAQDDARLLLERDPNLLEPRGKAARALLYLMDRDKAFLMLKVG